MLLPGIQHGLVRGRPPLPLTTAYLNSDMISASGSSFTFSNRAIGAADATRHIFVTVGAGGFRAQLVTSVTVAGEAATPVTTGIYYAKVPAGSNATIVVTTSEAVVSCAIGLFRVVGAPSMDVFQSNSLQTTGSFAFSAGTLEEGEAAISLVGYDDDEGFPAFSWNDMAQAWSRDLLLGATYRGALATTPGSYTGGYSLSSGYSARHSRCFIRGAY